MTTTTKSARNEALGQLNRLIEPGDTIYTILRHVARSGMYRVIDMFVIRDNQPLRITYSAAILTERRYDRRHEGMGIAGCGGDVGFQATHHLARALFPDGFGCTGEGCPSNDHINLRGSAVPSHHRASGYALNHRWL